MKHSSTSWIHAVTEEDENGNIFVKMEISDDATKNINNVLAVAGQLLATLVVNRCAQEEISYEEAAAQLTRDMYNGLIACKETLKCRRLDDA